jgi:pyruvate kinase
MTFSAQGMSMDRFSLTDRDRLFIKQSIKSKIDFLGISFVQSSRDIEVVRKLLPRLDGPMIIAKIETAEAVQDIASIIDVSDALMIARGDLGFSIPLSELSHIQKSIIARCLERARPVITATQMLESMIHNRFPTRAEVTDIANAILDGTDAVMLSAETSIGDFPVQTVKTMAHIIHGSMGHVVRRNFGEATIGKAVASSAVNIADQVGARLIIVFTASGMTARRIARYRPHQPIVALSPKSRAARTLRLVWGVSPQILKETEDFDQMIAEARKVAKNNSVLSLKTGDHYVISSGVPFGQAGTTNLVLVQKV